VVEKGTHGEKFSRAGRSLVGEFTRSVRNSRSFAPLRMTSEGLLGMTSIENETTRPGFAVDPSAPASILFQEGRPSLENFPPD
jgi:hypothetical protein